MLGILLFPFPSLPEPPAKVRITSPIKFQNREISGEIPSSMIANLLKESLDRSAFNQNLIIDQTQAITCQMLLDSKSDSFENLEKFERIEMGEHFRNCTLLSLLQRARPSTASHLGPIGDLSDLRKISPSLLAGTYFEDGFFGFSEKDLGSWTNQGKALQSVLEKGKRKITVDRDAGGNLQIVAPIPGEGNLCPPYRKFFEMGRGDVTGDGVEDLIITIEEATVTSNFAVCALAVVTRDSPHSPYKLWKKWRWIRCA